MAHFEIQVNNQRRRIEADPDSPLLYVLRDQLELNGPKFGCGLGQCGACTVHIEGQAVRSCAYPVAALEGLGSTAKPSAMQQAFIDEQAAQCGYCINGMIMQTADLLNRTPKPTEFSIQMEMFK